ncbi:hypothetical protein [Streptosporangium pseudovulgare]|uniref:Uncharacterized protein n=1 Tax=Streptosporangium pseudovulgare TaxID=35765 RepID=A0ABQ2RE56_9ACTN|nr:hypothetical protein [Streptosporangium pseudovulgare]GGQ27443.1 hypothetical protein GCM10010140_67080 [Streptosporangium pseudovulgare]
MPVEAEARLLEIHSRYGPEHPVSRSITKATPCITAAVHAAQAALDAGS